MVDTSRRAAAFVAIISATLIAGALVFQWLGYAPCEMCMWQRWVHAGAATFATMSLVLKRSPARMAAWASILIVALSGAIGTFHAGVEWKLWDGITTCSARFTSGGGDVLVEIMRAPIVRCDEAPWRLFGISMAGYNALISIGAALTAAIMISWKRPHTRQDSN